MADLFRTLWEMCRAIAPLVLIMEWESGVRYRLGRYTKTVGPGWYLILPGLTEVRAVSMAPAILPGPLQSVTLRESPPELLTFSATFTVRVVDAAKAINATDHWQETAVELASGMLGDFLADADPKRFDPARGKRDRLLMEFVEDATAATAAFGVAILAVRLPTFVRRSRSLRLITDPPPVRK